MNSIERKRRKYLQRLMNLTKENIEEEKSFMYKQTHDRHMKEIREKNKVSPNGGLKPFKNK